MVVYTYYDDINFKDQVKLIELWKISWRSRGFTPIVLNHTHAKQSPFYNEYVYNIHKIHKEVTGKNISKYGLSCFLRWLAYSTTSEDNMIVCDYDVINGGVDLIEYEYKYSKDKLNMLYGVCPCISIGTPSQFGDLCKIFINVSYSNIKNIQLLTKKRGFCQYHDQEFFVCNKDLVKEKINMYKDSTLKCFVDDGKSGREMLTHFSYHYTKSYIDRFNLDKLNGKEIYEVRIELIKDFLKSINCI